MGRQCDLVQEWDMLALRRQISRLKLLYKAVHCSSGLKIPDYSIAIKKLLYNELDLIIRNITHLNTNPVFFLGQL